MEDDNRDLTQQCWDQQTKHDGLPAANLSQQDIGVYPTKTEEIKQQTGERITINMQM
jgi:hypothetical protein